MLDREAKIYIAGHGGLAGSAIWRHLSKRGFTNLIGITSQDLDLTEAKAVRDFFAGVNPDVLIDAAAKVGGIQANINEPVQFLQENLKIQINLLEAAHLTGVKKLVFLGSSCIYPKFAPQPLREDSFLQGSLEETNLGYAIAKIAGVVQVQSYRKQYNRSWISVMPTNLYGPGDNFHPEKSHVLAGLMLRFHNAVRTELGAVTVWGSGSPLREFMHVDDLASAVLYALENYDSSEPINIGSGEEVSISELAEIIAEVTGFEGEIIWDRGRADGTPRKKLDSSRLESMGWKANWNLRDGIEDTYKWFLSNVKT